MGERNLRDELTRELEAIDVEHHRRVAPLLATRLQIEVADRDLVAASKTICEITRLAERLGQDRLQLMAGEAALLRERARIAELALRYADAAADNAAAERLETAIACAESAKGGEQ